MFYAIIGLAGFFGLFVLVRIVARQGSMPFVAYGLLICAIGMGYGFYGVAVDATHQKYQAAHSQDIAITVNGRGDIWTTSPCRIELELEGDKLIIKNTQEEATPDVLARLCEN